MKYLIWLAILHTINNLPWADFKTSSCNFSPEAFWHSWWEAFTFHLALEMKKGIPYMFERLLSKFQGANWALNFNN